MKEVIKDQERAMKILKLPGREIGDLEGHRLEEYPNVANTSTTHLNMKT